jgi:4'-phosphopantetheinyl transferase
LIRERAATAVRTPVPGVCSVWWARPDDVRPEHDALLSAADLERRSRLRRTADRQRLTAAWAVARLVLGAATGTAPDRLAVDRRCPRCGAQDGKPWLPTAPDLHVSVSHSGDCVVVAVAAGAAVGVDVEETGPIEPADLDRLAHGTLAAEELAELARVPRAGRAHAITTWWTRKEAVLKATGEGLTARLDELVVSPPGFPPRVLRWEGRGSSPVDRLSLHALHPPHGFVATVAVLGDAPTEVLEDDAGPLLRGVAG